MKFKPGDKVSFLNEKGAGTVTKVFSNGMVHVSVDGEFEIPYPENQLVYLNPPEPTPVKEKEEVFIQKQNESFPFPTKSILAKNLLLVFFSDNEEDLFAGNLQVYLLNQTSYDLLYTLSLAEKGQNKLYSIGEIEAGKEKFIETIKWSDLDKFGTLHVNIVYYKAKELYETKSPVGDTIKINPVKFFKESGFKTIGPLSKRAFVIELIKPEVSKDISADLIEMKAFLEQKKAIPKRTVAVKRSVDNLLMEVDLHIEELVDNSKGLSNSEMLNIQLAHFQKKLEEAIANRIKKVVFIHGVGTGVLKGEVRKILSTYEDLTIYDASYNKYGLGATEVRIK